MYQSIDDLLNRNDLETDELLDFENIFVLAKNNSQIMAKLYSGK